MYNNQTVSVITPVYNCEKYIAETIESALSQTYQNIEIVLVDDCSTDKSSNIIEDYKNKYSDKIVYYKQEKNMGAAVARNTALENAKGRYVAFLDSDDLWYPEKIEKQLELMKEKDIAFCYTAYEMVDNQGALIKDKVEIIERAKYRHILKKTVISTPTVVLDRQLIGNLKIPSRRTGQDYAYWLLLLRKVKIAYGIDEVLVTVRRRVGSLSKNKFQNIKDVWEVQRYNENISLISVIYNTGWYMVNSFSKRFL
jgi:teichuronic acid biosynthesis glycosyltransferase TuaG